MFPKKYIIVLKSGYALDIDMPIETAISIRETLDSVDPVLWWEDGTMVRKSEIAAIINKPPEKRGKGTMIGKKRK